mmetsp:Transcript_1719/g.4025  ORF Transcript_1719/g.4025 Transcript_1719/m.4025 type:complete len:422 (+) Transcript_1719:135-1400(+)
MGRPSCSSGPTSTLHTLPLGRWSRLVLASSFLTLHGAGGESLDMSLAAKSKYRQLRRDMLSWPPVAPQRMAQRRDWRGAAEMDLVAHGKLPYASLVCSLDDAPRPESLLLTGNSLRVGTLGDLPSAAGAQAGIKQAVKLPQKSWFALTFSIALVVKALCMMSNVVASMSLIPQVLTFRQLKGTGDVDAAPFISIMYGGCQWCFYGFFAFVVTKQSGFLILVYSNALGAVLGTCYVAGFQYHCCNSTALRKLFRYYQVVASLVVFQLFTMMLLPRERALFLCGLVSSLCSIVGACSLLSTVPVVLKTRCSASINAQLVIVGMISNALWITCGVILWDAWIMVPSSCSICLQTVALGFLCYFPRQIRSGTATDPCPRYGATGSMREPPMSYAVAAEEASSDEASEDDAAPPADLNWGETGGTH